jgi:hypothetical protein
MERLIPDDFVFLSNLVSLWLLYWCWMLSADKILEVTRLKSYLNRYNYPRATPSRLLLAFFLLSAVMLHSTLRYVNNAWYVTYCISMIAVYILWKIALYIPLIRKKVIAITDYGNVHNHFGAVVFSINVYLIIFGIKFDDKHILQVGLLCLMAILYFLFITNPQLKQRQNYRGEQKRYAEEMPQQFSSCDERSSFRDDDYWSKSAINNSYLTDYEPDPSKSGVMFERGP